MNIQYTAWYRSEDGPMYPIHGEITEEDLIELVKKKENRSSFYGQDVELDSVDFDNLVF